MKRENENEEENYFLSVDVGTKEVRVGIVSQSGVLIDKCERKISLFNPQENYYEQNSEEIWDKICQLVFHLTSTHENIKKKIRGISFDATCSLVLLDENNSPVSVSLPNSTDNNNNNNDVDSSDYGSIIVIKFAFLFI